MSHQETRHQMSRRGFLKTTAVAAGAGVGVGALAAGALTAGTNGLTAFADYRYGQIPGNDEVLKHCICRPNCIQICHINVHVRDGKVVKTSKTDIPLPGGNISDYNRICQRGLTHVDRIYGAGRLRYPMRRVEGTERGAGEWEKVSWDDAIAEIAEKATSLQAQYGPQAVCFCGLTGNGGTVVGQYYGRLKALMGATTAQPCNDIAALLPGGAYAGGMGNETNEITDVFYAKTCLVVGANITDAQVQAWHFIKEAHQEGVQLVVVDPTYTPIASKADWWLPVRPGSDCLLYFGLINILRDRGAFDEDFIMRHTSAPFLVRADDAMFLRDEAGERLAMVDGAPVAESALVEAVEAGGVLDLYASYTAEDGVACETALAKQMALITPWTPELVAEKVDITVDDLERLADIMQDGPVYEIIGYGPVNYKNGAEQFAAGYLLHALIGNIGRHGGSYGNLNPLNLTYDLYYSYPVWSTTLQFSTIDWVNIARDGKFAGMDFPVKMAYFYCANPLNTAPNTRDYIDVIFPSMDFIVTVDSAMTDTARYSDLVLPCAQHFEMYDFITNGPTFTLAFNDKAIDPPYECKTDFEIVKLLADKLGFAEYFPMDEEETVKSIFEVEGNTAAGWTWEKFKQAGAFRWAPQDTPYVAFEGGIFGTATGKFEMYTETPATLYGRISTPTITEEDTARMRLLANWVEPSENWYENPKTAQYPLSFLSVRPRFRVHSQYFAVGMLREVDPEPMLYVNPTDAAARGIADGAYVEAFNDRGHGVGKCVYSEAVRPGTVVYPKGWQTSQHKAGGWSELLNPDFSPWTCSNNFPDCLCDIRVWNEGSEQ